MLQYLRKLRLSIEGSSGKLDLSTLRVVFFVEQQVIQRPNTAEIYVYNVSRQTAQKFIDNKYRRVTLEAGYEDGSGIIFTGNVRFSRFGQETPVDKRLDLFCGDGDEPYVHAVTNTTLPTGHTYRQQVMSAFEPMKALGLKLGYVCPLPQQKMNGPRVLFGNARDILREVCRATGTQWSIQNNELVVVEKNEALPNGPVELNSRTGLIGLPTQTPGGIVVRTLLDPRLGPQKLIKLNNASIQLATPDLSVGGEATMQKIPTIDRDGIYKIIVCNRTGDTHGGPAGPWFNELTCLAADGSGFVPQTLLQYVPQ